MIRTKSSTRLAVAALVPAVIYYAFLLTLHSHFAHAFDLLAPTSDRSLTFNSMLLRLLQGSFDVDPRAIGSEGFVRDGKTYAYFGIFPALFRAPFLTWPNFETTDFTRLSCLTADSLVASFKVMSTALIWRTAAVERGPAVFIALVVAILFSGAQIQSLNPSIYSETILWANAFAAAFIYFILVGIVSERGFTTSTLSILAIIAGLCLLTRVSTAVGLYTAFGLLWIQLVWKAVTAGPVPWAGAAASAGSLRLRLSRLLLPVLLLLLFAAFTGFMNIQRWGSAWTFVDYSKYIIYTHIFPERFVRFRQYGIFNVIRIGYGIMYYFFPVWVIRDNDGKFLGADFYQRALDGVELPPGSFFVSDPLLVGLAIYMIVQLVRYRQIARSCVVVSTALGLSIPAGLMLTFQFMSPRYRMEFYPVLEFCAFVGFRHMISNKHLINSRLFTIAAVFGVVYAQIFWFFLTISPGGDVLDQLQQMGWIAFYRAGLHF
jgi:hypothetical protein